MTGADAVPDDFDPGLAALGTWPAEATSSRTRAPDTDRTAISEPTPEPPTHQRPTSAASPTQPTTGERAAGVTLTAAGGDIDQSRRSVHATRDAVVGTYVTINHHHGDGAAPTVRTVVRRQVLDWEYVHTESVRAIAPPDLGEALSRLSARHLVVLAADPHEGSETACLWLARELMDELGTRLAVERFPADREDSAVAWFTESWAASGLALIDLLDAASSQVEAALNDLGTVADVLKDTDSYLILVVPRADRDRFDRRYPNRVVGLGRPDAVEVFDRRLGPAVPAGLADAIRSDEWFAKQLRSAWPPRAARLATMVTECFHSGQTTLQTMRDWVKGALSEWSSQLRQDLEAHPDPWVRTLLFATATVEGADADTMVRAARAMVERAKYQGLDDPHPLVAPSVVSRLREVPGVTADAERVEFERPEFGRALLPHVWVEYPALRTPVLRWLTDLPAELSLTGASLERLADRVAELAIARDDRIALSVARGWAGSDKRAEACHSLAVRLLTATGTDSRIGRSIRDQLWQWARFSTDSGLQLVLVDVCGGQYGQVFPRNALTRLKHLANAADPDIRRAVTDAVARVGAYTGIRRLVSYLDDWWGQITPGRAEVLAGAVATALSTAQSLVDLAEPHGYRRTARGDPMAAFWREALTRLPYQHVGVVVDGWLAAASRMGRPDEQVLVDQLVQPAVGDPRRVGQLIYAARRSPGTASTRDERLDQLVARLRTRLDELESGLWTRQDAFTEAAHGER